MIPLELVLGVALLAAPPQSAVTYGPPPYLHAHYPVPDAHHLGSVGTGDLDGDGDVDVAVAGSESARVLWSSGQGWIERMDRLELAAEHVAVADLDGDGVDDVVVAGEGIATALLADGQGGFGAASSWRIDPAVTALVATDLDADARPDLIVATWDPYGGGPARLQVFLGDGQGSFSRSASLPVQANSVEVGDLDRDGDLDLVIAPGPCVLAGDGQGGFAQDASLEFSVWNEETDAVLVDLDGDGWLDLVAGCIGLNGLFVWRGSSERDRAPQVLELDEFFWDLCAGDLDGDGDADLLARELLGNGVRVLLNDGLGQLTDAGRIGLGNRAEGTRQMALADLDGDGARDLVASSYLDVALLLGDGAGWFQVPEALPGLGGWLEGACVALGDVNGDGNGDIVSAQQPPRTLLGDGQGGFSEPLISPGPGGLTLALGDLNGDGVLDLVLGGFAFFYHPGWPPPPPQPGVIGLGEGSGLFPHVTRLPLGGRAVDPVIADLDHDGDRDLAFADSPGVCVLLGDGGGGFVTSWVQGSPTNAYCLAAADVDLDGHVDLLAGHGGGLKVLRGDGSGAFPRVDTYGIDSVACTTVADLDGDGLPDVAVGDYLHGVSVLWGQGVSLSAPDGIEDTVRMVHPRDLLVADVDGDGTSELLVAFEGYTHTETAGGLGVLRSTGPREFAWTWCFGHGDGVWSVATGDLDGDGRLDLVSGSIYVFDYSARKVTYPVTLFLNQLPPEAPCSGETTYCVARVNSAGCLPRICSDGTPTLSGPDDFVVHAERVLSHQPGLLIWGLASSTQPFQGGTLCIAPPLTRTSAQDSGGAPGANDCSGRYALSFSQAYMLAQGLAAGTRVCAQFWSRDPFQLPPASSGLTHALQFTIAP